MSKSESAKIALDELIEIDERFSSEDGYTKSKKMRAANEDLIFHFLLRCLRKEGKQISFARVRVTESDGVTPFKPNSLYLYVTARGSVLKRDGNVSELQVTLAEDIEEDQIGYVVKAEVKSYGPDSGSDESIDDCAKP